MSIHFQTGFDLNYVRHYSSVERAEKAVVTQLATLIDQGVMFNVIIVEQTHTTKAKGTEKRFVPMLTAFRVSTGAKFAATAQQAAVFAAHAGFYAIG
jgi:hypothetical protein